jgi:acetate kinase
MHVVLVINCGSSSIKYQVFRLPSKVVMAKGLVECIGSEGARLKHQTGEEEHLLEQAVPDHDAGMQLLLQTLTDAKLGVIEDIHEIGAVGHRVVHGGEAYSGSVLLDDDVIQTIRDYCDLAPLHNPPNLTGIQAAQRVLPEVPQVAVFDTAFHQTIPAKAYLYALPHELYEKYRVRRYGFHGTSHHYVAERAAEMLGKPFEECNLITCHLGNGCSITAIRNGRSVDTSMGLTPLEGVAMGTRSGDIDPAIIFFLAEKGYACDELNDMLNKQSGLLGVSGLSNDMRDLVEAAGEGNRRARLAIDIFNYRIRKYIGAYLAVLGRVDGIVFTGGIGENNPACRQAILGDLEALGLVVDAARNEERKKGERDIAADGSRTRLLVIPTNEEGYIANEAYRLAKEVWAE